jgi:excisionase family DNA binding protein
MIFHKEDISSQPLVITPSDGSIPRMNWTNALGPSKIQITRCNAMQEHAFDRKKPPTRETIPNSQRLLVGRKEAADLLSISARALDYLVANHQLTTRRIGARVLIPISELQRFARTDHPDRLAS